MEGAWMGPHPVMSIRVGLGRVVRRGSGRIPSDSLLRCGMHSAGLILNARIEAHGLRGTRPPGIQLWVSILYPLDDSEYPVLEFDTLHRELTVDRNISRLVHEFGSSLFGDRENHSREHRWSGLVCARLHADGGHELLDVIQVDLTLCRFRARCLLTHTGRNPKLCVRVRLHVFEKSPQHPVETVHGIIDLSTVRIDPVLGIAKDIVILRKGRRPVAMHRRGDVIGEEACKARAMLLQLMKENVECQYGLPCPAPTRAIFASLVQQMLAKADCSCRSNPNLGPDRTARTASSRGKTLQYFSPTTTRLRLTETLHLPGMGPGLRKRIWNIERVPVG